MTIDTHRLVLDPLGDGAWRLCDRAADARDAESVIAYVEQRADGLYAVTGVARGVVGGVHPTLGAVLRDAAGLLAAPATGAPVPVPHRPRFAAT